MNNDAWVYVDAARDPFPDGLYAYDLRAFVRRPTEAWLAVVHELARAVDAAHGSILLHDNEAVLRSELWGQHESHEGREVHPDPTLITALATKRYGVGDRWVRPARWGTYLRAAHVESIGGRERIETIEPAIVREVGSLLYIQLSSVAEARATATIAREQALGEILAPLALPRG